MWCFVHFDIQRLQMRFAPQRHAIFRHLSFKKWSEHAVFCTFWLANALRAKAACHFSRSELQKLVRECGVLFHFDLQMRFAPQQRAVFRDRNFKNWSGNVALCIFTWKRALCHSGVPFSFLGWAATYAPAALASLLFEHPEPRIIAKTQRFATFLTFGACGSSF